MARTQALPTDILPTDTSRTEVHEVTFTRCAVRTATGIAADLGWLHDEFAAEGTEVSSLQDAPPAGAAPATARDRHRGLRAEFREAGSIPALWARSRGASTRLVGLTWVDERQVILARADAGYASAADLRGRRVGIPRRRDLGVDFREAMALQGFACALSIAGLGLSDVQLVEMDAGWVPGRPALAVGQWGWEFEALSRREVDAVYVKGALAVEAARGFGASVVVDLDRFPDRRLRVNNGTPRPITVEQRLLDERPDVVARFLATVLRAADWAVDNQELVTGGDLHPALSRERLALLERQKEFLRLRGFLAADVDLLSWIDPAPLGAARAIVSARSEHASLGGSW